MRHVPIISGVFLCFGAFCFGRVITVSLDGSGEFSTIQAAIDAAVDCDEVVVADGTYTGDGNRDIDFRGKAITVRSAGGAERCLLDNEHAGSGFYFHTGEGPDAVVAGFTVKNGTGIGIYGSSPTIRNCTITENSDSGIHAAFSAKPTVIGCVLSRNTSWGGGGIRLEEGGTIIDCMFIDNSAYTGGALWSLGGVEVRGCTFHENSAATHGGAVYCSSGSFQNCIFYANRAGRDGGAIRGSAICTNCVFNSNQATGSGGAVAQLYARANVMLVHCTLYDNRAASGNGVVATGSDGLFVLNSILCDGNDEIVAAYPLVRYSRISGGWPGEGNISADPEFRDVSSSDPSQWDLHIAPDSPCIDAGTACHEVLMPTFDLDGNTRALDGDNGGGPEPDMGAYEFSDRPVNKLFISDLKIELESRADAAAYIEHGMAIRNRDDKALDFACTWAMDQGGDLAGRIAVVPPGGRLEPGQAAEVRLGIETAGLPRGVYSCVLRVADTSGGNRARDVEIRLFVRKTLRVPGEYPTIQAGIDAALQGDVVEVADGVYEGDGNRDISFKGKGITVRSESGPARCVINCQGSRKTPHRGFVFVHAENNKARVEGFTIVNGYANDKGGGIYCLFSGPEIINCRIKACKALGAFESETGYAGWGGGICGSFGLIRDCRITSNDAGLIGGGIADCMGPILNCVIAGNNAWNYVGGGGGAADCGSIRNCTIAGNFGTRTGGGVLNAASIENCIIWDNTTVEPPELWQVDSDGPVRFSWVQEGRYPWEDGAQASPLFAEELLNDPNNWDCHLRSVAGRWDAGAGAWVYDAVTSPCIDAGDPAGDWRGEFWPHGRRINMGAYGGTREASMSPSAVGERADLDYDDVVGFGDFGLMAREWGYGAGGEEEPPWFGDLNRDGIVGLADLAVFADLWALE